MTSGQSHLAQRATAPAYCAALLRLALLLPAAYMPSAAADNIIVHAVRQGAAVAVEARALLAAPLPVIWATLTDYDRFSNFIPGMYASRVIERRGASTVVQQFGEAGLLLFRLPIDVVVESREIPPHAIEIRVLSGNLRRLDGRYQIEPDAQASGQFVLRWSGVIEPQDSLPPLVGVAILRANIGEQFRGMVREIERRARLLPDAH
jgi:ribosome-associated toxin RatA of RatAB toxin-antitoxin module